MESKSIDALFEKWFKMVSPEFPPELIDTVKERARTIFTATLSGEDPELVVERIEEEFLERVIRESGSRLEDIIRRLELFANELSKQGEFKVVAENFVKFVFTLLRKILAVYRKLLTEEFKAKMKAYEQIEQNIEQFAILVDQIRNPLAAALGFVEIYVDREEARMKIKGQLDRIAELVEQLEKGWIESEAIRNYLRGDIKNEVSTKENSYH